MDNSGYGNPSVASEEETLRSRVEELEAKVEELQSENSELKKRLESPVRRGRPED